jgi:hypothetical protein
LAQGKLSILLRSYFGWSSWQNTAIDWPGLAAGRTVNSAMRDRTSKDLKIKEL